MRIMHQFVLIQLYLLVIKSQSNAIIFTDKDVFQDQEFPRRTINFSTFVVIFGGKANIIPDDTKS